MLQIKNIRKQYITGDLVQTALDDVSLNFRDNEFVAILGPSGSGKTTMLNIIGGLDRYDSGDLVINGISTRQYTDRDWDSYRNHTIGFVFQSYNLIPHQTVLANVELALTISGISKSERRQRAKAALEQVGLGNQLHKKPNQMSGGQMQRVAIARALVNNPAILLADEPTGALDSETSVQVMDMLKEVAKDRLVIMVTHNPELAYEYATRIVKVKDGKIKEDSMPLKPDEEQSSRHENMGKSSMSPLTALGLSFNNLKTKKGRTLLTSFAGSIGIIGIALILSLSNGVNTYIQDLQRDTMTSYPISIEAQSFDFTSLMLSGQSTKLDKLGEADHKLDGVYSDSSNLEMASNFQTSIKENNLSEFKKYLDDPDSEINKFIGGNGIVYNYDTKFAVYAYDEEDTLVNTDGSTLMDNNNYMVNMMLTTSMASSMPTSSNNFEQIMPGANGELISPAVADRYEILYGSLPNAYNEVVLVLDKQNELPVTVLYQLGYFPSDEYKDIMKQVEAGEDVKLNSKKLGYTEICSQKFYLLPECDLYEEKEDGLFKRIDKNDTVKIEECLDDAIELRISGVIRLNEDTDTPLINSAIGYTSALTEYLIEYTDKSDVVRAQEKQEDINILNGMHFDADNDKAQKLEDVKKYIRDLGVTDKAMMFQSIMMSEQLRKKSDVQEPTKESKPEGKGAADVSFRGTPDAGFMGMAFHPDTGSVRMLSDFESVAFTDPFEPEETMLLEEPTEPEETGFAEETTDPVESSSEPETEAGMETTEETEAVIETLPDDLTPEMLQEYLESIKDTIAQMLGTGKDVIDSAIEESRKAYSAGRKTLKAIYDTIQAIGKISDMINNAGELLPSEGMSQEDLLRLYLMMMAGGSSDGMSMEDLMGMFNSASGMEGLLAGMGSGGSSMNMQDLLAMYMGASGMQDLLSGFMNPSSSPTGGMSPSDLMGMYAASSGLSQEDLMKMFMQNAGGNKDTQDLLGAYASASGMTMEELMAAYGATDETMQLPDGMTKEELMAAYLRGELTQEELMAMYAQQQGLSQEDMQQMMSLANMSETELAQKLDEYMLDPDEETLLGIYEQYIASGSYDKNMSQFGVISFDAPTSINLYVDSFEAKESIQKCIEDYNQDVPEENQISYTDYVGLLMSSVTTIVNVISYVLIAFVAVSLIVSSIMIGIITYISVLERTKEIGILRAIGASKRNISQVFNAETFIIGLCSGLIGVIITELLLIPGNIVIHSLAESDSVSAILPGAAAVILVLISIFLTCMGGLIPSKKAATKDPVTALRTD